MQAGSDRIGPRDSFNETGAVICFCCNKPGHCIAQCHAKAARQGCGGRPRGQRVATLEGASSGNPEFFKLLRDASDASHPSNPNQSYLTIASIFLFLVCKIKEYLQPNRPYVNVQIGPAPTAALYDSGANISCISETKFRKIPVDKRPSKLLGACTDKCFNAGGDQLMVTGIYNLPICLLG